MLLLVKIAILVSLIKLLLETDNVPMCAGLYATVAGLFTLLLGAGVMVPGLHRRASSL